MQFKINFCKNTSKESAFSFIETADNFYKQQYADKGYILLDYILDGLGVRHEPFGLVGFNKYNPYAMVYDCVDVISDDNNSTIEYVSAIYINLYVNDFTEIPNIDAQFIKNKMALRGAKIKDLKTMEELMNKYFPEGLLK